MHRELYLVQKQFPFLGGYDTDPSPTLSHSQEYSSRLFDAVFTFRCFAGIMGYAIYRESTREARAEIFSRQKGTHEP